MVSLVGIGLAGFAQADTVKANAERTITVQGTDWGVPLDSAPSVLDDPLWLLGGAPRSAQRLGGSETPSASNDGAPGVNRATTAPPRFDSAAPLAWPARLQDWVAPTALVLGVLVLLWIGRHTTRRRRKRRRYRMLY